jgi:dihydrofolate reductase
MRKITFGGANSLDNYIARPDNGVDWLLWGDEAAEIMRAFWKTIDTVLWGRKTFEVALGSGAGSDGGSGGDPGDLAGPTAGGWRNIVFSRTLPEERAAGATLVRDGAAEFVRKLKQEPGKDICLMGGGELARSMFEEDLIDEVGFNIHPVLLGAGIPLFHGMSRQIDLELQECRPFKNGCVYVSYRVKHTD